MDETIFNTTLESIQEKIGEENTAKIVDDLGILRTAQNQSITEKQALTDKLAEAERSRSEMQAANARLLQQIPVVESTPKFAPGLDNKEEKAEFDPRTAFDKNGRIKK